MRFLAGTGMETLHARVEALTGWLLSQLMALSYPGGAPLVRVYGPTTTAARGGTVTFNVLSPDGQVLAYRDVEQAAGACNISLRGGCFCNPGASEAALGLTPSMLEPIFGAREHAPREERRRRHAWGMVRASIGIATTPADISRFVEFIATYATAGTRSMPTSFAA